MRCFQPLSRLTAADDCDKRFRNVRWKISQRLLCALGPEVAAAAAAAAEPVATGVGEPKAAARITTGTSDDGADGQSQRHLRY